MSEEIQSVTVSRRIIWPLLLCSLAIESLVQITVLLPVVVWNTPNPSGFQFLLFSLPQFIIFLLDPLALFGFAYVIGRKVELSKSYVGVIVSLFIGGLIGGSLTYFGASYLLGAKGGGGTFPNILTVVTTIADFLVRILQFGFSTLFVGFSAVAIANLRKSRSVYA